MSKEREAIYISDLTRDQPGTAISDSPKKSRWQAVPYEADGVSGTMLLAGLDGSAPTLTLPLGLQGWYAIHLGIWTHRVKTTIKVRLSGDPAYTVVTTPVPERWSSNWWATIKEVYWKFSDLTDQDLLVSQLSTGQAHSAAIAYIKLEPLSGEEVTAIQADRDQTDTKRLIAHNDGGTFMYFHGTTSAEEIWEELEPFRHTDFQKLIWGVGGGTSTSYFSNIGDYPRWESDTDHARVGSHIQLESYRILREKGIDPLKTVIDYAHRLGMEVHGSYRLGAWAFPPPENTPRKSGRFHDEHPEWRCVDRDGRLIARMSYAFPAVRRLVISILREVVEWGADGVCLTFIRGVPCVLYEQPLLDSFRKQYGQDPLELAEDDPRWLTHKAMWVTNFVREVREELNEMGKRLGRRVQLSAYALNNVPYCLSYGLDVGTWAQEGLVDFIISNPTRDKEMHVEVAGFAELVQGTNCRLYADMLPRQMSPAQYQQKALDYYNAGADGLAFWDATTSEIDRLCLKDQWSMIRRLGHKEDLPVWEPDEWPSYRDVPLYTVAGLVMDRHSPYWYG